MKFTGERFILGQITGDIEIEHIQRYKSVINLIKNKVVLDAACGEGYGSFILSKAAKNVLGIDVSQETISYAKQHYENTNLEYKCASIEKLPLKDSSVDVIISFETIEHVNAIMQELFLAEIKRVLKPDGIMIMSSPDKRTYSDIPNYNNPYHVHELYLNEFEELLKRHFTDVELFFQGIENKRIGIIKPMKTINSNQISLLDELQINQDEMRYIIAICSMERIKSIMTNKFFSIMPFSPRNVARIFVDIGNGIDGNNVVIGKKVQEDNDIICMYFDLNAMSGNIYSLRFDPVEKIGCICNILQVESDVGELTIKAINATKINGNIDYFFTWDPQYCIVGNVKNLKYVKILYTLKEISIENLYEYLVQKQEILTNAIISKDKEISNKDKEISNKDKELNKIYSSKGYQLLQKYYNVRDKFIN